MSSQGPRTWFSIINELVHTVDDVDICDIEALSKNFVVVKRGFINVHYYYIPVNRVEGWDGSVLWLKSTESQVRENYERNVEPDPFIYYVREQKEFFYALFTSSNSSKRIKTSNQRATRRICSLPIQVSLM